MIDLAHFKQQYMEIMPVDVKWGEMDAFQHVNNTVYIRYFEDGRINMLEHLGMGKDVKANKKGPILASITCDYLTPITYPDTIYVGTNIKQTGAKKITLEQVLFSKKQGKIAAKASSLCVYYDHQALTSCEVTEPISQAIAQRIQSLA